MAYNPNQPRANDGKWDGGGGAAGSHAAGIKSIGKPVVAPRVLDAIRAVAPGKGISISLHGDQPTHGYMVSSHPERTHIVDQRDLKGPAAAGILNDFARKNSDLLTKPGAHIGTWVDRKSGKTYLDVSSNVSRKGEAVKAGRSANQIAVWDVRHQREIRTGGSGK